MRLHSEVEAGSYRAFPADPGKKEFYSKGRESTIFNKGVTDGDFPLSKKTSVRGIDWEGM